jgi:hypothetical protein
MLKFLALPGAPYIYDISRLRVNNNAEVVVTMTVSEICQAVVYDTSKLAEESECNCTTKEEEILEAPPTNAQM